MEKTREIPKADMYKSFQDRFNTKERLDVNDLLKKRVEEDKLDKKKNIYIFSSVFALVAVVLIIFSL